MDSSGVCPGLCGIGDGDCDSAGHCQAGLACGHNNCLLGATTPFVSTDDCCYDPNDVCGPVGKVKIFSKLSILNISILSISNLSTSVLSITILG